ncbi:alpha/beta hydrolase fold protein [Variibacter gotjawalensis]|uniref:Alpha/beta hydrolase fold protein n=1 Tax=Variibacter gotjawalensis TaxID=1333996 RepID=A0A0S3PZS9_9BRAD|nr:alpha/beta hydrolase [Variibacter gotjawalensis]NIK47279.1 acetyl esterase/lipase [Variibacter gotjawalensis]RZS49179.1 acetyl esterase/lipase [Variibacter gotjawalensis]BAT61441.1 alpha/beta hydrolase fold protein [Variibacter gotjawalensis]
MSARPQDVWATLSQEQRDASYNNNLAVKNSAELIERRNAASEKYRAAHAKALDIPYGDKPRMAFDLYPAENAGPTLIFIHGGYWQRNSREVFATYAEGLNKVGWSVAMPSYSLAPQTTLTEIVNELRQSLDWLAANGAKYDVAGPYVLSGWSAGGHLTAMLLDHSAVVAGLAISGVYELGTIRETYLNDLLKLTEAEVTALSPLRLPVINKPMTIAYGDNELPALVSDSRKLHAMRTAAGAVGPLIPIAGEDHFSILDQFHSGGALLKAAQDILALSQRSAA